jgi:type III pantothenate kinase
MQHPVPEFLLIDIGNTRIKWTLGGKRWPTKTIGDIATKEATAKWIRALAKKYKDKSVVLACVVPKLIPAFRRAFSSRLIVVNGTLPELVCPIRGLSFDYPKPAELGADRLAVATAVHAWQRYPAIIIACGTATAFTVLDAKGRLCGGVIAPGLQTQLRSLIGATAQLPDVSLKAPRHYLGRSTKEAVQSGVMLNFLGGVKEIIRQLTAELAGRRKPQLILTGGNAPYIAQNLGLPVKLRPLLVFEGLLIIGSRLYMPVP